MSAPVKWWALPDRPGAGPSHGQPFAHEAEALAAAAERATPREPWLVFRVRAAWSLVRRVVFTEDAAAMAVLLVVGLGWALVDVGTVDALLRGAP